MAKLSMVSLLFPLIVLLGQTSVSPAFEVASVKEALPLSIDPGAADLDCSAFADQIEVDHIALSEGIRCGRRRFGVAGRRKQDRSEFFRIGLPDSN
jgi:hypothetical protein